MMIAVLTPDNGSRKTQRGIFDHCEKRGLKVNAEDGEIGILNGKKGAVSDKYPDGYPLTDDWSLHVMEDDYYESSQISADEGQIVVYDLITYGYGERISWEETEAKRRQLIGLLDPMVDPLKFTYEIFISANFW